MHEAEKIVSKLYFIRSIISRISEYNDEIADLEANVQKIEFSKDSLNVQTNNTLELKKQLAQEELKLYQLKHSSEPARNKNIFNPRLSWIKNRIVQIDHIISSESSKHNVSFFITFLCVTVTVLIGILWLKNITSLLRGLLFGVAILLAGPVCFLCIVKEKQKKAKANNTIERLNKEKKELEAEAEKITRTFQMSFNSSCSNENNISIKIASLKRQIAIELQEEKEKQVENKKEKIFNQIHAIDEKRIEFNNLISVVTQDFIDQRDLRYLDFIIYLFETGRADTMKEALQQTDLHIRHNEITGMMQTATASICSSIQSSIKSLSFSLSDQLSSLRSELAQNNSELSDKFDSIISSQELNNTLLAKANVSSEKLVKNLDYLKERREYQYHLTGV